jgi:hypothetical protein
MSSVGSRLTKSLEVPRICTYHFRLLVRRLTWQRRRVEPYCQGHGVRFQQSARRSKQHTWLREFDSYVTDVILNP